MQEETQKVIREFISMGSHLHCCDQAGDNCFTIRDHLVMIISPSKIQGCISVVIISAEEVDFFVSQSSHSTKLVES